MEFHDLAIYFDKIEKTSSRLTITEQVASLFETATPEEIAPICYLLQGRVAPLFEPVEFGIADKFMIRAIALSYGCSVDDVILAFRKQGDLGIAAQELYPVNKKKHTATIMSVFEALKIITSVGGEGSQEKKIQHISTIISGIDALSVRYLVRIPLGKMRLGLSDMTILDSLSWMLAKNKTLRDQLESAYNLRPDIGYIAEKVKVQGITGIEHVRISLGTPVLSALCQRLPTADEMIEKMTEVAVEPKYDGVRVQIHWKKGIKGKPAEISTFSRNLENTTLMFTELEDLEEHIHADEVILDAEAVGINPKTGEILPFQETTTRKRKHDIAEARESVPLRFFIFDILAKNGQELLSTPLVERKKILKQIISTGDLLFLSPYIVTDKPETIREFHREQLEKGLEGVVVKKWDSGYQPGRKAFSWVKFKEEEGHTGKLTDTIDAVVMGYYTGEGKRASFGIGAFLVGVKDGDSFVTVTKIGTGVSDDLWKSLLQDFTKFVVKEKPKEYGDVSKILVPDVWITPSIVVEIAGDDLTKSSMHGALYAVRFPRLVKIRTDKSAEQITTKEEIETLYKNQ